MPIMMDRIDLELCLNVDQHEPTPHKPDDVNITGTDANDLEDASRPRRTRTFSEVEEDSTDRSERDPNPPKRPRVAESGGDIQQMYSLQEATHSGEESVSEYQRQTQAMGFTFPYHGNDIPTMMNPLHATMGSDILGNVRVPMATDITPGRDATHIELESCRSSFSSIRLPYSIEGNMTSFSSVNPHSLNRFTIYEDPDGMDIDTSHIEFSQTWSSYASRVEDDKENFDGDEDADDESEIPNVGNTTYTRHLPHARAQGPTVRSPFPFPSSSFTLEPDRSIQDEEDHEPANTPIHSPIQQVSFDDRDQLFRRPWDSGGEGAALPRALSRPTSQRYYHLSEFDADDEADQDILLTNSRQSSSMSVHHQAEIGYSYRSFSTADEIAEISVYCPLMEIPSMSPVCPEITSRGPSRPRRIRAVNFPW